MLYLRRCEFTLQKKLYNQKLNFKKVDLPF